MIDFEAKGHFVADIIFTKSIKINIDKDIKFFLPLKFYKTDRFKEFTIYGKYDEKKYKLNLEDFIDVVIENIFDWMVFYLNCYVEIGSSLYISSDDNFSCEIRAPFPFRAKPKKVNRKNIDLFTKNLASRISSPIEINFYRKALTIDDPRSQFWYLYNIAQINFVSRKKMNEYLIKNYKLPKGKNNLGETVTIFVAIRDAFSHPENTFNGKKLNLDNEIRKNSSFFLKIFKEILLKKFSSQK